MSNWYSENMPGEISYDEILDKADQGEFHRWNYEVDPFSFTENGYEDVIDTLKQYSAEQYLGYQEKRDKAKEKGDTATEKEMQEKMDAMVNEVYDIYRSKNVYPITYFSEQGIMQEIEKCIAYKAYWDGDTVSCGAGIGTTLCKFLFPNLEDTPSKHDLDKAGAESIYAKFMNEQYLKRAIRFCYSYKNGFPVPTSVEGGLRLVGSAPSNFRPMNAKAIYERFCPENGVIYDFCCVDDETEYFNGKEWKSLKDYTKGDKVLQYNEDGTAKLVEPIEYIHYQNDKPFYEYNSNAISSCQTGNHDVVYIDRGRCAKVKQEEILHKNLPNIPITCLYSGDKVLNKEEAACYVMSVESTKDALYFNLTSYTVESKKFILEALIEKGFIKEVRKEHSLYVYTGNSKNYTSILNMFNTMGYTATTMGYSVTGTYSSDSDQVFFLAYFSVVSAYLGEELPYKEVVKEDKYCFVVPSHMLVLRRKGKIYITGNCGFGGRLLGALSSKKNFRYVGTDPNTETMYHLHELAEYIEMVTGRGDSYELHCCGSEDFKGKPNSIDFAFSSPPYFDLEIYSDEPTQCYNKFPKLEEWLEGYVRQTIKNISYMLKPGRFYAVNIADFTVGKDGFVAYVDEWIKISTEEGMPLYDTVYLGVTARAGSKEQAAGELKKENILIFKKN